MSIWWRPEMRICVTNHDRAGGSKQHSRGGNPPELCVPSLRRGRRECRVHDAPTALRAGKDDARRLNTGPPTSPGTPCAMVYGLLRALPGVPGLLASVTDLCVSATRPKSQSTGLTPASG